MGIKYTICLTENLKHQDTPIWVIFQREEPSTIRVRLGISQRMTLPSQSILPPSWDTKPVWPTSSDTWRRERVKRPSRRISLSQSPLSRPHGARSSVWLVTLIPQEDSELSLPSGLKPSQNLSLEDSTRIIMLPRNTLSKSTLRNILKLRTPRNTSTEISKESESIALSLESLLPLKLRNASLERRSPT